MIDGDDANPLGGDQLAPEKFKLRAIGAEAYDSRQLAAFYRQLADDAEKRLATLQGTDPCDERDVFDLKGDKLGMTLAEFKQKHHRRVPSSDRIAPFCSDEFPGQAISDLCAEPWHTAAGIVHARIDLPDENAAPTIAGVKSELVLYQFIDARLFQISSFFRTDAYHVLRAALGKKLGPPVEESETSRQLRWWTMNSTIELAAGSIRPPAPTALSFRHDDLVREAAKRKPDPLADL